LLFLPFSTHLFLPPCWALLPCHHATTAPPLRLLTTTPAASPLWVRDGRLAAVTTGLTGLFTRRFAHATAHRALTASHLPTIQPDLLAGRVTCALGSPHQPLFVQPPLWTAFSMPNYLPPCSIKRRYRPSDGGHRTRFALGGSAYRFLPFNVTFPLCPGLRHAHTTLPPQALHTPLHGWAAAYTHRHTPPTFPEEYGVVPGCARPHIVYHRRSYMPARLRIPANTCCSMRFTAASLTCLPVPAWLVGLGLWARAF